VKIGDHHHFVALFPNAATPQLGIASETFHFVTQPQHEFSSGSMSTAIPHNGLAHFAGEGRRKRKPIGYGMRQE
jgi:hypothetical protein